VWEHIYSMFCIIRGCVRWPFYFNHLPAISTSLAFEPIVFAREHLLGEKFQLASGAFGQFHGREELFHVTAQTYDFFGDIGAVGEKTNFLDQVGRIEQYGVFLQDFLQFFV